MTHSAIEAVEKMRERWVKVSPRAQQRRNFTVSKYGMGDNVYRYIRFDGDVMVGVFDSSEDAKGAAV